MPKYCTCDKCGDSHTDFTMIACRVLLGRMPEPMSYRRNVMPKRKPLTLEFMVGKLLE